jgi:hypothetical protein
VGFRLNPPPGWPPVPAGFVPLPGWQPGPSWPAPPPGWQLWLPEDDTPHGYPAAPPYGWPSYAPPPATSGLAIASLVLGVLGFLTITAVLGIVALVQLRSPYQRGRGLAIAWTTGGRPPR